MVGNGHTHNLPRSVNVQKKGKLDTDTLQDVLEAMKNAMVEVSSDVKELKQKQELFEKRLNPVVYFHKKVLTIASILAVPFTMLMGWIGAYIKAKFFN
jgi:hypothetical protein